MKTATKIHLGYSQKLGGEKKGGPTLTKGRKDLRLPDETHPPLKTFVLRGRVSGANLKAKRRETNHFQKETWWLHTLWSREDFDGTREETWAEKKRT